MIKTEVGTPPNRRGQYKYFWDGKRFWFGRDGKEYHSCPMANLRLLLRSDGFRNWKMQAEEIKCDQWIDGAWPVALHAAGDFIFINKQKFLCTETILPTDDETEGDYPFISKILDGILGKRAAEFVQWLAHAKAYTRGKCKTPPKVPCLIGDCKSQKGLLAEVATMTLNGWWYPRRLSFLTASIARREFDNLSDIVWLLNITDCQTGTAFERKLATFARSLTLGKPFGNAELTTRRVLMVRCHDSNWKKLEPAIRRQSPQEIIVLPARSGFYLMENEESMTSQKIEERVRAEIRQFRHHLLTVPAQTV